MNDILMQKILEKQIEMASDIGEIKSDLNYHVKRTDLLEESVSLAKQQLEVDLAPIKAHVLLLNTVLKLAGGLSIALGVITGIIKIVAFFR